MVWYVAFIFPLSERVFSFVKLLLHLLLYRSPSECCLSKRVGMIKYLGTSCNMP
jgi:hypothetical protein